METHKSIMLSKVKKVTLFILLLVLILIQPIQVYAKKKNTNKKSKSTITWIKKKQKVYAKDNLIIYSKPQKSSTMISTFITNEKIRVLAISKNSKWYKVKYKGKVRYVTVKGTSKKKNKKYKYKGKKLNKRMGVCYGPSGRETYYNMNMSGVISTMRRMGFSAKKYPYWIRDDGCKMLGPYIMVGANLKTHPRGSLVKTSLGTAIVCDTGGFAKRNPTGLDLATSW